MPDTWPLAGPLPATAGVAQPVRSNELAVREDASDDLRRLVLRAKTGDTEAFGTLYDRYLNLVYRYVYFRVGSHPLAEDLTSETFLRALRRIADFTWQGRDFGAWLVTIARNLITDHFKSGRYRLEVSTAEVIDTPLDGPHIPENAVVTAMVSDRVLSAVRDLGPEQQECVVLRFLHGMSLAETALIMGKKSGAIKALQFRAIRALARALPPDLS
ncbi:sigma-70 family RNA polymerase sigma factor [Streptosporangium subroseum]|jgi:RNA polymerase sigma-70 factor (TIGR02952 family)|uniref:RNA polymerase sigma-70 factor, ECF subfamily n=1 Tax=Streptosporangium subroseum TaxID=106412 RepID=A0A239ICN8_9ACTN|nr:MULTISPECIES: sigma-70 family RNA polymerase sigma factor [Streptosporangium]AWS40046.1 RNA polymerase subunit sigma-70 [Streptosporangium sp. 'caverna']WSA16720.1 sigma-70 family RNA polymerase sigma factor [Streptosporangium subroseum]SNS91317.1 RNA polymerase sigma-70 factor, ECF subfamily [Streptosporangium subroseum]